MCVETVSHLFCVIHKLLNESVWRWCQHGQEKMADSFSCLFEIARMEK